MSESRINGFRECARKARDLLQPMVEATGNEAVLSTRCCPQSACEALENAWKRLLTVDKTLGLSEPEIRTHLSAAYDSLETASGVLRSVPTVDSWPDSWRSRLAQARSLVFASGGSRRTVPPSRRSSSSTMHAVRSDGTASIPRAAPIPRSLDAASAPVVETSEVEIASLGELGPELLALLEGESSSTPDDRSSWGVLEIEVGFVGDNNFFAGLSMDVSEGGLFVATWQPSPVDTRLMLSFVLPDGHSITTPGVVRFIMEGHDDLPPGMGIGFADLSDDDLQAIRRFCKMRRPTYYEMD